MERSFADLEALEARLAALDAQIDDALADSGRSQAAAPRRHRRPPPCRRRPLPTRRSRPGCAPQRYAAGSSPPNYGRSSAAPATRAPPPPDWLGTVYRASLVDRADPRRWMLLDRHRLPRLAAMYADGSLVDTARAAGASSMHAAVIAAMAEQRFEPAAAGGAALAVAADVARWLRETTTIAGLPGDRDLSRDLGVRLRDAELDRLRAGIVGREAELAGLAGFAREVWLKPPKALPVFPLEGIGGVGKSTLLAEFVRAALPALPTSIAAPLVAWIDYDRFQIRGDDVRTVAMELTRQFGIAEPAWTEPMAAARAALRGDRSAVPATATPDRSSAATPDNFDDIAQAAMADTIVEKLQRPGRGLDERPVLVVLDTVEQLDNIRGKDGELLFLFDSLRQRALPRLLVVASGRRVFSRGYGGTPVQLPDDAQRRPLEGLSSAAARAMLTGRERMEEGAADKLLAAFADLSEGEFRARVGVPMVLGLLARYFRRGKLKLDAADVREIREAADAEAAAAYIYFRVLEQLPPPLRRFAEAGIALREVSAAMLADVVWPVIRRRDEPVTLPGAEAATIFDTLVGETWLVDVVANADPPRITHRADLRRAMLHKFYASPRSADAVIARRLNTRARAWHRAALAALPPGGHDLADARFHRLGIVYYALALGVFNGRPTGLKISEVKAIAEERERLVADFPEEQRPMVEALFGGSATPAELGAMAERLRTPVIKEMLSGFIARRQYRDGMAFALALDPRDRARSPTIARAIVRCFLYSGQWTSGAAAVAPLVAGRHAAAIEAGRSRPYLLPVLAASIIGGDATAILADRPAELAPTVIDWYDAATAMFGLLEDRRGRAGVEAALARVIAGLPPHRPIEDRLRFVRVLGCLQRVRLDPDAAEDPDFVMALRRGGHPLRLPLMLAARGGAPVSAAQFVGLARDADVAVERGEAPPPPPAACVALVESLTTALASALVGAGLDNAQFYRLVAPLWKQWPVAAFDLRPQTFADACTPSRQRERLRTLCAFAERTDRIDALLDAVEALKLADPDIARVIAVTRRWRTAFILPE